MSENMGDTWPEQNAVYEWLDKFNIDVDRQTALKLIEATTAWRLKIQAERDTLAIENKRLREALESIVDELRRTNDSGWRAEILMIEKALSSPLSPEKEKE